MAVARKASGEVSRQSTDDALLGGDYPLSSIITSEFATTKWRGAMMGAVFAMQGSGQLAAAPAALVSLCLYKAIHRRRLVLILHAGNGHHCSRLQGVFALCQNICNMSRCLWRSCRQDVTYPHWGRCNPSLHRPLLQIDHSRDTSIYLRCCS